MYSRPPRGGRGLKSLRLRHTGQSLQSPPSRGAWIEIVMVGVASVRSNSRPPRGGRGLKYAAEHDLRTGRKVAPLAGGVD